VHGVACLTACANGIIKHQPALPAGFDQTTQQAAVFM